MGRFGNIAKTKAAGSRDQMFDHEGNFVLVFLEGLIFPSQNNPREEFWKTRFKVLEFTPKDPEDGSAKLYRPGTECADMASFLLQNDQGSALLKSVVQALENVTIDDLPQEEQEALLNAYVVGADDGTPVREKAGTIVRCRTYKKKTRSGKDIVARAWSPASEEDFLNHVDAIEAVVSA